MMPKQITYLILFLLVFSLELHSQENTDVQIPSNQFKMKINASGRYMSGVFSQRLLSGALDATYRHKEWDVHNVANYTFMETNGLNLMNDWYDLLTVSYYVNGYKRLHPLAYYHFDNNLIFRVEYRHRTGIGLSYLLLDKNPKLTAAIGIGTENAKYTGENFVNSEFIESERNSPLFILSLSPSFSAFDNRIVFSAKSYYFHALRESSDFRIWILPKAAIKVTKNLSVNLSYDYRYENVYLQGYTHYNDMLMFGISYSISNKANK